MTKLIDFPATRLPVMAEADVCVVGGGTAGFCAGVAAARTGAKTILVERFGYLGGCLTSTYNTTPGWFGDSEGNQIIGGIPWEFIERMEREGEVFERAKWKPQIWPPTTKKIALDMIAEAGVDLYFYTWASDVIMEDGMVKGIVVQSKAGRTVILAKTIVDASADADIAAYAGAPFDMVEVDELQQVSMDLTGCGVDVPRVIEWARANQHKLKSVRGLEVEHQEGGAQPMFTFIIPNETGVDANGQEYHVGVMPTVKLCVYRDAIRLQGNVEINPLDPKALTYAEVEGLQGAMRHLKYLKDTVPGMENVYVVAQNHLGVRESRRIIGDYVITLDDLHNQSRFDDVVALNCRALDYHLKGTVFKISFLEGNHDVPLRSLTPQGVENIVVAGRCTSCDHLSHASMRGAATCMATGHSAGTAAALAAAGTGRIRDLPIRKLQRMLLDQGAILSTKGRTFDDAPAGISVREAALA
jgi:ribulose 1,5-bisphosphate synthetase/thiazole synthase